MANVLAIYPDHSRIKIAGNTMRATGVTSPQVTGEAVVNVVRNTNRIGFIFERNCGEYWPKDLFLRDRHVVLGTTEQHRSHKTRLVIERDAIRHKTSDGHISTRRTSNCFI